jgi:GNAT superfamily N-acetyltransferase
MTLVTLPNGITIEDADPPSIEADAGFWRIYRESFPASERDPRPVVKATADPRIGFALRARSGGATIGLLVAHKLRNPAVVFLVYLAVDAQWRSHRLGSALLATAETFGADQFGADGETMQGMVWEIDDPADADVVDGDERTIRLRRRRFFERAGGRALDLPYLQPPIDGHSLVPMQLMYKPRPGARTPDGTQAQAIVRAIYREKYGPMNGIPDDTLGDLLRRSGTSNG